MPEGHSSERLREAMPPNAEPPGIRSLVGLATAVVVLVTLYLASSVLIPITLAILLSLILTPLVSVAHRAGLSRVPAVSVAMVVAVGLMLLLTGVIGRQVADLMQELPRYETTVVSKISSLQDATIGWANRLVGRIRRDFQTPASPVPAVPPPQPLPSIAAPTAGSSTTTLSSPLSLVGKIISPVLNPLATLGIVLVVAFFILLQKEDLRDRMIRLFGAHDLYPTSLAIDDAGQRLSRYFLTQLGINTVYGLVIGTGLFVIGLPKPLVWGIVAALLRFIPYVGWIIAAALPAAIAVAIDPGWSLALWTVIVFTATETITGQIVEPVVFGHSTGLSPFAIIVAAIFWGWLWGPIGLILSTPLTLCLVVLGRHFESLQFLDVIFGDRPALTPAESFYHCMLGGRPDQAADQALALLKHQSLSSYYDDVAVKALHQVATDVRRGAVSASDLQRIQASITRLVEKLAGYREGSSQKGTRRPADIESAAERPLPLARMDNRRNAPPPTNQRSSAWQSHRAVACIGGAGPFDNAVAVMLAQLISKRGLGAFTVAHDEVASDRLRGLDVGGTAMLCVACIETEGHHDLVRRLRDAAGDRPILIGMWPADDAIFTDAQHRAELRADYYVTSLGEAVEACVAEVGKSAEQPAGG